MITAGQLDRRATLLKRIPGPKKVGGGGATYEPAATFWCRLLAKSGQEVVNPLGGPNAEAYDVKILCRYRSDVKHGDRIRLRGEEFAVVSIIETERLKELSILANRVAFQ